MHLFPRSLLPMGLYTGRAAERSTVIWASDCPGLILATKRISCMVLGKLYKLPNAVSSSAKWGNNSTPLVGVLVRLSQDILKGSIELGPSKESARGICEPTTTVHQHQLFACRNRFALLKAQEWSSRELPCKEEMVA